MAEYRVLFTPFADAEILESYEWGAAFWGEDAARLWLEELYSAVFRRLAVYPLSCPIAPESAESETIIRQYLVRRYRILLEVNNDSVVVLHLAGPFNPSAPNTE